MRCLALCLFALLSPLAALAEGRSIIVLDGSGSMWGQIDGRPKLEIAREALGEVLRDLPAGGEVGLMAYGHREKGSCEDIELLVPPAQGTGPAIAAAANALQFKGKTPLSEAVRRAAAELRSTEEKATVILITDGIETCAADPCALGAELEASGVDFTAHVVGFGLSEDEGAQVACLAKATGGCIWRLPTCKACPTHWSRWCWKTRRRFPPPRQNQCQSQCQNQSRPRRWRTTLIRRC